MRAVTRARAALLLAVTGACATTGVAGRGDENLPSAGVGPFRKLADDEVQGVAPFVLDDRQSAYREPSVLLEGASTILFAVASEGARDVIVRTRATDGRSFYGTSADVGRRPEVVLTADAPWEGARVGGPFALRVGAEVRLYYAAEGGIGLARSADGRTFQKAPAPVLVRDAASPWETTPLSGPTAYVDAAGKLHLFYASGSSIGEAESDDGVTFRKLGVVLGPAPPPAPGSLAPNEKPPFDAARVADPCVSIRTTPAGRVHVRVLYTGEDEGGATTIGFAARYGDSGALERASVPVYAVGQREAAPALAEAGEGTFLYVQQERRGLGSEGYLAVAAAFAPGNVELPAPSAFPDAP